MSENKKIYPKYNFEEFPVGYFSDNKKGKALRNQLIKNELKISQDEIGALETAFFSKENIDLINKQLILRVYRETNKKFKICPQKEQDLIIVMRYVFIEYGRNLPFDIQGQIKDLNCTVVGEILPIVITNVDQKVGYLRDISTQPVGPPLPINTKNLERTLPSMDSMIFMKPQPIAKIKYTDQIIDKSNIQGFPGLQGFDYDSL
jgi:hypothetical protein